MYDLVRTLHLEDGVPFLTGIIGATLIILLPHQAGSSWWSDMS